MTSCPLSELRKSLVPLNGVKHMQGSELGRGAYGLVYKVSYKGSICAAKMIHPILVEHERETFINSFLRECALCRTLLHENIVEFLGICYPAIHSEIPVMVMEMMDESLTKYIGRKSPMEVTFSTKISILLDITRGLGYLHSQRPPVVHRDLSPNNVLLKGSTKPGGVSVAKIGDLGVAKVIKIDSKITQTKVPGTVAFMPPEATKDSAKYGVSLDVFSFGGIVMFVATHEWPEPTDITEMDPKTEQLTAFTEVQRRQPYLDKMTDVMEKLKPVVIFCLNNNPEKRPAVEDIPAFLEPLKTETFHSSYDSDNDNDNYVELDDFFEEHYHFIQARNPSKLSSDDMDIHKEKKKSTRGHSSSHLWYVGSLSHGKAESMVKNLYDGVFLVRENSQNRGEYNICIRWKRKPYHVTIFVDPKTNLFYLSREKKFSTIYELVEYYQEHSLKSVIPDVTTPLKYPYYIISSPPKRPIDLPWPVSSATLPPGVEALTLSEKAPVEIRNEGSVNRRLSRKLGNIFSSFKLSSKPGSNAADRAESPYHTVDNPVEEPWYHNEISRADAVKLLSEDGDYLVRFSDNQRCYVLTAMCKGEVKNFIINKKRKGGQGYSLCGPTFPSISDLLKHYTESPIPIKGHPQSLKRAVCKQIRNDQFFIHHDNLAIDDEPFCKGTICYIYSATLRDTGKQVAVKVCCADKEQFLCEAKLLEQFRHPNIIKLFSMCVDTEPMYVVLEMMSGGDFLTFLRKDGIHQTQYQLTKFSLDAALGMEYLASQKWQKKECVHRAGPVE
ncbi:uncharacterized protein [Dysidea avara]|uniref:uncharacterized protein isoform X2 n=1 Tax=Dysidea avara TaxID=196820 RepID=UPI00332FADD8